MEKQSFITLKFLFQVPLSKLTAVRIDNDNLRAENRGYFDKIENLNVKMKASQQRVQVLSEKLENHEALEKELSEEKASFKK